MLISYLARIFGALGLMALGLYALLAVFVPEVPGISWVGAGGAVAVTFWVYFDWEPITRFVGSRGGREQMVSWGLMLVAAGICGMVLHIGERKPKRWDFTEGRIHSLNSKTEQILTDIPAGLEVEIKGYYRSSFDSEEVAQRKAFERLGDAIQSTGSSVDFQLIDPEYSPLKASRDGVTSNGTVIVIARPEGGDDNAGRSERLQVPDEAELANALIRVISSRKSTIYWISGHGERSPETRGELSTSLLTGHLVNLGFEVKSWSSLKETEVPSDATVLILAAPKVPLAEREAGMIREWVEEGGSLMVLSEPQMPGQESAGTGLEGAMLSWGLRLRDDLAIDPIMSRLGGDPAAPIADRFGSHEITKGIDLGVVFVTARSVEEQSADAEQVTHLEPNLI